MDMMDDVNYEMPAKHQKLINEGMDSCPLPLQSNSLNVKNHLKAIEEYGLGPADPREANIDFWSDKARKWNCTEGDARGRLCANCGFYVATSFIKQCIDSYPAKDLKASQLPVSPQWTDIESRPQAYCTALDITCSPIRTCDIQKMGGPIDDKRGKRVEYRNFLAEDENAEQTS